MTNIVFMKQWEQIELMGCLILFSAEHLLFLFVS